MIVRDRRQKVSLTQSQIGEIGFRSNADPQRDGACRVPKLKIVYDEGGLWSTVHVKTHFDAARFDFEVCPLTGYQVDIRFIFTG